MTENQNGNQNINNEEFKYSTYREPTKQIAHCAEYFQLLLHHDFYCWSKAYIFRNSNCTRWAKMSKATTELTGGQSLPVLLVHSLTSLYPALPRFVNCLYHCYLYRLFKIKSLQFCLQLTPWVSTIPSAADSKLFYCSIVLFWKLLLYHSHPTLSPLAQNHWTHWIQAPLTYLQNSHN